MKKTKPQDSETGKNVDEWLANKGLALGALMRYQDAIRVKAETDKLYTLAELKELVKEFIHS